MVGSTPGLARLTRGTTDIRRADVILTSTSLGDLAGTQMQTGDLDGDGVEDVVIAAYEDTTAGPSAGAVYIVYGPTRRSITLTRADAKLIAPGDYDFLGEGPLGVADLDSDGADDLIIGSPGAIYVGQGPARPGEAFVLYGGKRLKGQMSVADAADAVFVGLHPVDWVGFGATGLGDLDRDGFDDAVIGAAGTAGHSGAAYLIYGRKQRLKGQLSVLDTDAQIAGGLPSQHAGFQAAGGDIDGDGIGDLVLRSSAYPASQPAMAYVFYGRQSRMSGGVLLQTADAKLVGSGLERFTRSVSVQADADVNGDGVADLVIGEPHNAGTDLIPLTHVIFGGNRLAGTMFLDDVSDVRIEGAGASVVVADLNGDRRSDVAAGAPNEGATYVVFGRLKAGDLDVSAADVKLRAKSSQGQAGLTVASGEVNGDQARDLLVGEPRAAPARVYLFYGGSGRRSRGG